MKIHIKEGGKKQIYLTFQHLKLNNGVLNMRVSTQKIVFEPHQIKEENLIKSKLNLSQIYLCNRLKFSM